MEKEATIETLKNALAKNPEEIALYSDLGNALIAEDQLDEARDLFQYALTLNPESPKLLNNYGVVLQKLGKIHQATLQFWRVLDIEPKHEFAHSNLGYALNLLGDYEGALHHCEKALESIPDNANIMNNYGIVLQKLGRLEDAILAYIKSTRLNPESPLAFRNLGLALQAIGREKEARVAYRRAILLSPKEGITYRYLADVTKHEKYTKELKIMETVLEEVPNESDCAKNIHFALGKAYDDLKMFDKSFYHLCMGNRLHRTSISYNPMAFEKLTDRIIETFSPDIMPTIGNLEARPIFILGMPRSGSTLVEQILASHSKVHAAGEIRNFNQNVVKLVKLLSASGNEYPEGVKDFNNKGLEGLGKAYLDSLKKITDELIVTNKMSGNFFYIGLIFMALPNARIIHTLRDPVDTCFSCYSKLFNEAQHFSYNLRELGRYYKNYRRLMDHWHRIFPGRILDIQYEDVVNDQEEQTRKILSYCGLEWEEACMSFYKTNRPVLTASANQVRSPIYNSAISRSKHYLKYLSPLLEELGIEEPKKEEDKNKENRKPLPKKK